MNTEQRRTERLAGNFKFNAALDDLSRRDHQTLSAAQRLAVGHYVAARDAHQAIQAKAAESQG